MAEEEEDALSAGASVVSLETKKKKEDEFIKEKVHGYNKISFINESIEV